MSFSFCYTVYDYFHAKCSIWFSRQVLLESVGCLVLSKWCAVRVSEQKKNQLPAALMIIRALRLSQAEGNYSVT